MIVEDVSSSASIMLSLSKCSPSNCSSSFSDASLIVFNTRASYKTDVDVVVVVGKLCAFVFSFSKFFVIVTLVVLVDAITEDAFLDKF